MSEVLQTLFHGSIDEQTPIETYVQLTAGPAASLIWEIDVLYICSQASSEISVSIKKTLASTDEIMLLNVTAITPGETVTIGPMAMEEGDELDVNVVGGTVDLIAYGREISTVT